MRKRLVVLVATCLAASVAFVVAGSGPAAGAVKVRNESEFRKAWSNPHESGIFLASDIVLAGCKLGVPARNSGTALTITGRGRTIRQTCPGQGVLRQDGTGSLAFDSVTITGGDAVNAGGGGIHTISAPVVLTSSTLTDNRASGWGAGGVFAASVSMTSSTVRNNAGPIGGIGALGTVTATSSTVNDNAGEVTGGIAALGAVNVANSTVSGNLASNGVGGVGGQSVTLSHATVAGNSGPPYVGRANLSTSTLTSFASVVALPAGGSTNCSPTSTVSNGFNFSDDASCGFTGTGDTQNGGDPRLAPLANNGGPTLTRLPLGGSPLIDVIPTAPPPHSPCAVATDQRGIIRPQGFGCDIGAVEGARPPD